MKSERRRYQMRERAASAEATRQRIIDATLALSLERWWPEITMREIAAKAGVALQTVVNHFGSKDGVLLASIESGRIRTVFAEHRMSAPPDDIHRAIQLLVRDYERTGDAVIGGLALERRIAGLRPALAEGRAVHRDWVTRTFPAALAGLDDAQRSRRLALLIAATDVYTWKVLRRDQGLDAAETIACMSELVEALYHGTPRSQARAAGPARSSPRREEDSR
jgi:AcrR family transcriptional regulator